MAKACDYYIEKDKKDWCILKNTEISRDTYKEYCYRDEKKKCPIYQYYNNPKNR